MAEAAPTLAMEIALLDRLATGSIHILDAALGPGSIPRHSAVEQILNSWAHGPMGPWAHAHRGCGLIQWPNGLGERSPLPRAPIGALGPNGPMGPWAHGPMGPWAYGPMRPWAHGWPETATGHPLDALGTRWKRSKNGPFKRLKGPYRVIM